VSHSDWAAPTATVPKGDGKRRICGDYKVIVNRTLTNAPCPNLTTYLYYWLEDKSSPRKIDLTQAYQQMVLDKESREFLTVNAHLGLYRYTCLPFGVAIFQRTMDTILQGLSHVQCYIDDILVTGTDDEEHLWRKFWTN